MTAQLWRVRPWSAGILADQGRQAASAPRRGQFAMTILFVVNIPPDGFRGDATWTDSPAVACAATSELWRRGVHTGSAFVTVSTAASIMERFFTLQRYSLRML